MQSTSYELTPGLLERLERQRLERLRLRSLDRHKQTHIKGAQPLVDKAGGAARARPLPKANLALAFSGRGASLVQAQAPESPTRTSAKPTSFSSMAQSMIHANTDGAAVVVRPKRLRTAGDAPHFIVDGAGVQQALKALLCEPRALMLAAHMGPDEISIGRRPIVGGSIDLTRTPTNLDELGQQWTNTRYLLRSRSGDIVAAAKLRLQSIGRGRTQATLTSLVVREDHRRLGHASRLLEEIINDHPGVRVRPQMTRCGAAFMGYEEWVDDQQESGLSDRAAEGDDDRGDVDLPRERMRG